ncbi:O-acetylhomoserine ami [Mycena crocata]|nr:O-acetylhomoserine ami [Mycena crocata]
MISSGHHFDTLQLYAGHAGDKAGNGPRAVPIHASVGYMFQNSKHGQDLFSGKIPGHYYSRVGNATVDVLEERMAALEGGVAAVAAASGQAAQLMTLLGLCDAGQNIIAHKGLFGGTYGQFKQLFRKFNITIKFVIDVKPELFAEAIDENTRGIFVESISNPNLILGPISELAKVAHEHDIPLVVDNTCGMGGYIIRPIDHGADIVVHSTTKWVSGHGTVLGGMIIDSGRFDWDASPRFQGAFSAKYQDRLRVFALKMKNEMLSDMGAMQNAFGAFLTLQGLETLSLRAQRHCDNALAFARWLSAHPKVSWVRYLGLKSHPDHARAVQSLRTNAFGGLVCFGIAGEPREMIDNLKLANNMSHMGDAKTLIIHPDSTTNLSMTPQELVASGVRRDLIRVSIGIENIVDIIADFSQALDHVGTLVAIRSRL